MTEFLTKDIAVKRMEKDPEVRYGLAPGRSKDVKVRMLEVLMKIKPGSFIYETRIYKQFSSKRSQREVKQTLAEFVSKGYAYRLGTGRRGDPFKIILSTTWPYNKCPFCNHTQYPSAVSMDTQKKINAQKQEQN